MKSIKEIKSTARQALKGQFSGFIALFLSCYVLENLVVSLPSRILAAPTSFLLFLSQILLNYFLQALGAMIMLGVCRGALLLIRRQRYGLKEILFPFQNQPDHFLALEMILAAISTICAVPGYLYIWFADLSSMNILSYSLLTSVLTGITTVLTFILTCYFCMSEYLMLDDPSLTAKEALKYSVQLIRGHVFKYILLIISFIGYMVLGLLSGMIGFVWILPYVVVSEAVFYEDLRDLQDAEYAE